MTPRLPEKLANKYGAAICAEVGLTKEGIGNLKHYYRSVAGLPGFMDHVLHLKPDVPQMQILDEKPDLIEWSDSGDVVMLPNGRYHSRGHEMNTSNADGLALVAWFIHPKLLEKTVFADKEKRDDFKKARDSYSFAPGLEVVEMPPRGPHQKTIASTEAESNSPYLADIVDLTPEHLEWLENLKKMAIHHLKEKYNVTENDKVAMYFHPVVSNDTATLHLHIRVNQICHPLEENNRVLLDDIIHAFERGQTIEDLLINRKFRVLADGRHDFLKQIEGVDIRTIQNPFADKSNRFQG